MQTVISWLRQAPLGLVLAGLCGHAGAALDQALYDKAQQSVDEFLETLEPLVNIDTGTGYQPGLEKVGQMLVDELKRMGAKVETFPADPNPGANIVATFEGSGKGRVLLLAHMDTVFEEGTAAERPFRVEEGRAYGPGVMDDKGGLVLALQTVKLLKELGYDDYAKITLLVNPDEEKGSFGSRDLIRELARQHDYAFTLEFGSPEDKVTSWRKGIGYYKLEVKGKSAHAGAEPEKGCNAALEIAHQVLQLEDLDNPQKETTVNFTIIQVGDRYNIIPDFAKAQADVRVLYPQEYERLESDFNRIIANKLLPCTEVTFIGERGRPPFPKNPATDALVKKAQAIYREIGLELGVEGSGGGTDGNYAASVGTTTLDALGPVGGGAHTAGEYIDLDRIAPRIYLLARLIMEVGANP